MSSSRRFAVINHKAVIFSDAGLDIRWVGNEKGFAGETNWSSGTTKARSRLCRRESSEHGDENGTSWLPAECDVSIRPGWF